MREMISAVSSMGGNAWRGQGCTRCRTQAAASSLPRALTACVAAPGAPQPLVWLRATAGETGKCPSSVHRHRMKVIHVLYAFVGSYKFCSGAYVRECCHLLAMQIRRGIGELQRGPMAICNDLENVAYAVLFSVLCVFTIIPITMYYSLYHVK